MKYQMECTCCGEMYEAGKKTRVNVCYRCQKMLWKFTLKQGADEKRFYTFEVIDPRKPRVKMAMSGRQVIDRAYAGELAIGTLMLREDGKLWQAGQDGIARMEMSLQVDAQFERAQAAA